MDTSIAACRHCGAKNRLAASDAGRVPVCGNCKRPLPWVVEGTDASFAGELLTPLPVLVDFWAEWCAPCRATAPVLESLAGDMAGEIKIVKVDVDHNPGTAGRFNVQSIPTLILFKNGEAVETLVGALSKNALLQKLGPYLS